MGKGNRNRTLRREARAITAGSPSQFKGIYRRAKKLGDVVAVIGERVQINSQKEAKRKARR